MDYKFIPFKYLYAFLNLNIISFKHHLQPHAFCICRTHDFFSSPFIYNSFVALEDSSAELGDLVIVHDTSPEYAHKTVDKIRHDIKAHMGQVGT